MGRLLAGIAPMAIAVAIGLLATPGVAQEKLTIWWAKGAYQAEDDALLAVVKKIEARSGVNVDLTWHAAPEMIAKLTAAVDAGAPPDIAYADAFNLQVAGRWAFEGKLEDISDVMAPIKDRFAPNTAEAAWLASGKTGKRAYYAFPLKQQTLHVQYWKDILAAAGFKENDIPYTWQEYWAFWCDKVQPAWRAAASAAVFGVGSPMGIDSTDSYKSFLPWVDAHDVRLVDEGGKVLVDDAKVRQGLIDALKGYTDLHVKGCTPPQSTGWKDGDNDLAFNGRIVVMTPNSSLPIADKWLDDANNAKLAAPQRAQGRKAYDELIATAGLPRKPGGAPLLSRADVKLGAIFQASRNKARARDFVKFLMEEDNLRPYVESALGRWFPVTKDSQKSVFWQADRQRKSVYDQFMAGTVLFEFTRNYKFATLDSENVWAKAMHRVVNDKVPVDKAVDELIARIKEVAG
jgi:multiple sugar transport system substrate-binding protein